jgi:hypothetical protein
MVAVTRSESGGVLLQGSRTSNVERHCDSSGISRSCILRTDRNSELQTANKARRTLSLSLHLDSDSHATWMWNQTTKNKRICVSGVRGPPAATLRSSIPP